MVRRVVAGLAATLVIMLVAAAFAGTAPKGAAGQGQTDPETEPKAAVTQTQVEPEELQAA